MNPNTKGSARVCLAIAGASLILFLVLTALLLVVDIQPIGPNDSCIGLATLNRAVFTALGTNTFFYDLTEVLGLISFACIAGFACIGLIQLVQRKSLFRVDRDLLLLAGLYAVTMALYVLFEVLVVNYRPILVDGVLEASYPSSHTMLIVTVVGSAMLQFRLRIRNVFLRELAVSLSGLMIVVTVAGRLLSGVHWFTDILAGVFLGIVLVFLYAAMCKITKKSNLIL